MVALHEIQEPARVHRAPGKARRTAAHPDPGRPAPGDHRNLPAHPARAGAGAAVRKAERIGYPAAGQSLRHHAARGAGHGARIRRGTARGRQAAFVPEGTATAARHRRCHGETAGVQAAAARGAAGGERCAVPATCHRRRGRGLVEVSHPDLLAGRRRPAHYLRPRDHQGAVQGKTEHRHLPPAGDRAQQGDHALAAAPRRRRGFSRMERGPSR